MDDTSGGMRNLSDHILTSHRDRKETIKNLKTESDAIRKYTAQFLVQSRKLRDEMSKNLKEDLRLGRDHLLQEVNTMRDDFRSNEKRIREDLAEAKRIWSDMRNILGGKPK